MSLSQDSNIVPYPLQSVIISGKKAFCHYFSGQKGFLQPLRLNNMIEYLVQLDDSKLGHLEAVIEDLVKIKKS